MGKGPKTRTGFAAKTSINRPEFGVSWKDKIGQRRLPIHQVLVDRRHFRIFIRLGRGFRQLSAVSCEWGFLVDCPSPYSGYSIRVQVRIDADNRNLFGDGLGDTGFIGEIGMYDLCAVEFEDLAQHAEGCAVEEIGG